jgi:hypothetical protein
MPLHIHFRIALALVFVASAAGADPPSSPGEPLTAKEVRRAEKEARTADDHLRLASYYEYQTRLKQAELTDQEHLVDYWGKTSMATRTKIPIRTGMRRHWHACTASN